LSGFESDFFDLARFVDVFNRHGVAYIAIGGVSGMLHGAIHYVTQDVHMMVRDSAENLQRIVAALVELEVDIDRELGVGDLAINTQWRTPSGSLDILLTALGPNETVITFVELARGVRVGEGRARVGVRFDERRRCSAPTSHRRRRDGVVAKGGAKARSPGELMGSRRVGAGSRPRTDTIVMLMLEWHQRPSRRLSQR
jgi:hypothetical protein